MVMRRKQRLGMHFFPHMLDDRAGNAHAIKSTRTAADFVKNDQTVFRGIFQNLRHLIHFDHERTLPADEIITRPDTRKDAVNRRN